MIRFVDLRYQGTGYRFAFLDTETDSFISLDSQAWDTFDDFAEDVNSKGRVSIDIDRCISLCPKWVFEEPSFEELHGFKQDEDVNNPSREVLQAELNVLNEDLSYQISIKKRAEVRCQELTTYKRLADNLINELKAFLERERSWNRVQELDRVKLRLENEELRETIRELKGE